ncbi:hypothetical protein CPB97_003842 [Podila verticillata]|nr:hypothetical protein CPB97_003842 [Podila verticillata]
MGFSKKDIDNEFQKLIDELAERAIKNIELSLDGCYFGHDADTSADDDVNACADASANDDANTPADDDADANANDANADANTNANACSLILTAAQQLRLAQEWQQNEKEHHNLLLQAIKESLFADPFLEQAAMSLKIPDDQRIVIDDRGHLVFLLQSHLYADWLD